MLAHPVTRALARRLCAANLAHIRHLSGAFRGSFKVTSPNGAQFSYVLGPDDTVGEIIYWSGLKRFEPETIPAFERLSAEARTFLDIGANTGTYALLACASNPNIRVVAWKPVPYLAKKMSANIHANDFDSRCTLRECAVADRDGTAEFYVSSDTTMSSLSHHRAASDIHTASKINVAIERIDSAISSDIPVDLMKIDVEGHELDVLKGSGRDHKALPPPHYFRISGRYRGPRHICASGSPRLQNRVHWKRELLSAVMR